MRAPSGKPLRRWRPRLAVNGAQCVEKLLECRMGSRLYVDMHLEVDPPDGYQAHAIAHAVKDAVLAEHPRVADVLVHIEPAKPRP